MKRLIALLPLTLFIAACSSVGANAPAPEPVPPPFDPSGVYDCAISIEGQQMPLTMTISQTSGAYAVVADSPQGPATMEDVTLDGNQMTFWASPAPEMSIYFALIFEGDSFTGSMDGGQFAANVSGKKR